MEWIITIVIALAALWYTSLESGRKQAEEEKQAAEQNEHYNPNKPGKRKAIHVKSYLRYTS